MKESNQPAPPGESPESAVPAPRPLAHPQLAHRWSRRDLLLRSLPAMAALRLGRRAFSLAVPGGKAAPHAAPTEVPAEASGFALRGMMVDAARQPESISYYRRCIEFCAAWNMNVLLFRLTDDQGSMLRFASHPELLTHPNALTPRQAHELALYAARHGVELVPEVESFGHTHYITGADRWKHLSDRDPAQRGDFGGVIPVLPETLALMRDLYREVAAIFPSRYFHGGCDEVNWGESAASRKALQTRSRAQIWSDYLNFLDDTARQHGKEFIVWGDYVVHKEPQILPLLHKDIIIMDWNYWDDDQGRIQQAAEAVLKNGSRLIGGPGLIWCRWGPRANDSQLRNIEAFADVYRKLKNPACLGVVVTNWIPGRYLADGLWDSFAYGAIAIEHGSEAARREAFSRFVQGHYGAAWDENWAEVFATLYAVTPNRRPCAPRGSWPLLPVPWRDRSSVQNVLQKTPAPSLPFTRLLSALAACEATVQEHYADFRSFALSVRYLQQLYWREEMLRAARSAHPQTTAAAVLATIAAHDAILLEALIADWNRSRPANDPGSIQPLYGLRPEDQLLATFRQAAAYSQHLAGHPEELG